MSYVDLKLMKREPSADLRFSFASRVSPDATRLAPVLKNLPVSDVLTQENILALLHAIEDLEVAVETELEDDNGSLSFEGLAKNFQTALPSDLRERLVEGLHIPALRDTVRWFTGPYGLADHLLTVSSTRDDGMRTAVQEAVVTRLVAFRCKSTLLMALGNLAVLAKGGINFDCAGQIAWLLARKTGEVSAETLFGAMGALVEMFMEDPPGTFSTNTGAAWTLLELWKTHVERPERPAARALQASIALDFSLRGMTSPSRLIPFLLEVSDGTSPLCEPEPEPELPGRGFWRSTGRILSAPQTRAPGMPERCRLISLAGPLSVEGPFLPLLQATPGGGVPVILLPATEECCIFLSRLYGGFQMPDFMTPLGGNAGALVSLLFQPDRLVRLLNSARKPSADLMFVEENEEEYEKNFIAGLYELGEYYFNGRYTLPEYMGGEPSSSPALMVNEFTAPRLPGSRGY